MAFAVGSAAHLLKSVGNGAPFTPMVVFLRLVAKSTFTGIAAAGIWAAVTTFYPDISISASVAIAAGTGVFGVDAVMSLIEQAARKKLGLDSKTLEGDQNG